MCCSCLIELAKPSAVRAAARKVPTDQHTLECNCYRMDTVANGQSARLNVKNSDQKDCAEKGELVAEGVTASNQRKTEAVRSCA